MRFLIIALLLIGSGSCTVIGTLYPLSENEKDFLFKKEFLGKWSDSKDSSFSCKIDTVAGYQGKIYRIQTLEARDDTTTDTSKFLARLVKIGDWNYFDIWYEFDEAHRVYLQVRHFIFKINFSSADEFELAIPDPDQVIKLIDSKKIQLSYADLPSETKFSEYNYLILDKPGKLQQALKMSQKNTNLFKEKTVLRRIF